MALTPVSSYSLISILVLCQIGSVNSEPPNTENVCSLATCQGSSVNGSAVAEFCESHSHLTLSGRCCFNGTDVLGLDLHKCALSEEKVRLYLHPLSNLRVVSLEDNAFRFLDTSVLGDNTDITYLSLSSDVPCPGGNDFWKEDEINGSLRICSHQLDICVSLKKTCPENSRCVHISFDQTWCLCDDGYHGYKCMKYGTFPLTSFLISLTVPSVILCVLLWVTQRRYVKKQD